MNNPAVTVLVVLDSPAGGYPKDGGGETAAPVFARIAQQVLAYMNVPHDVELQDPKRMWLRAHTKEDDISEAAPDYIASAQENADTPIAQASPASASSVASSACAAGSKVADCGGDEQIDAQDRQLLRPVNRQPRRFSLQPLKLREQPRGTVVLDVAGGVLVPDFHGKSLRVALEEAESAGLELEVNGSGVGQEQSPAAGSRIPPGGHVSVRFGR